jgi:hypothetical protein
MDDFAGRKITCPDCGEATENMKRTNVFSMIFLGVGARWQTVEVTCCPACTRKRLLKNGAINIVTANLMWPLMILPVTLYQYASSYKSGHDARIVSDIRSVQFNRELIDNNVNRPNF